MELHTNNKLLSLLLVVFMIGFVALGILALDQFNHPFDHFRDLVTHDRVVQMIMFDFIFFFIWVFLWMIDRGKKTGRVVVPWLVVGIVAATLMVYIFILTGRKRN